MASLNPYATTATPQPLTPNPLVTPAASLFDILTLIGVGTLVVGLIYIGKKIQVLDHLSGKVDTLTKNSKVVTDFLTRNAANFDPSEIQALSPMQLTEAGKRIVREIGFDDIYAKNTSEFEAYIVAEGPRLKYDVESAAIKSVFALYDRPFMEAVKVFIYNNPKRTLENMAPTLGIFIRDAYLAAHPEIQR